MPLTLTFTFYESSGPEGVPWPQKDDTVLFNPHLPDEYARIAKASSITGVVVVEASDRRTNSRWVLDLVDGDDFTSLRRLDLLVVIRTPFNWHQSESIRTDASGSTCDSDLNNALVAAYRQSTVVDISPVKT